MEQKWSVFLFECTLVSHYLYFLIPSTASAPVFLRHRRHPTAPTIPPAISLSLHTSFIFFSRCIPRSRPFRPPFLAATIGNCGVSNGRNEFIREHRLYPRSPWRRGVEKRVGKCPPFAGNTAALLISLKCKSRLSRVNVLAHGCRCCGAETPFGSSIYVVSFPITLASMLVSSLSRPLPSALTDTAYYFITDQGPTVPSARGVPQFFNRDRRYRALPLSFDTIHAQG